MYGPTVKYALTRTRSNIIHSRGSLGQLLESAAARTRARRLRKLSPMASLSSLPEDALYHILKFVDENDDARSAGINKSWANLRRVWVVSRSRVPGVEGVRGTGHNIVQAVAFSCDGKLLAIGAEDDALNVLTVHDAATGDLRRTFPRGRGRRTLCLDFSPTDSTVLVAGGSRDLIAYNTATGNSRERWRRAAPWEELKCVTFSPAGSTIAFCHANMVAVIDIGGPDPTRDPFAPARVLLTTQGHPKKVEGIAFSPTGSVLAVGIYDGTVTCYDVATGQVRSEIEHDGGYGIWTIAYSSRGTIAAGGPNGKLALYDASNGQLLREVSPAGNRSCFSPDGSMVAANSTLRTGAESMSCYDTETGDLRFVISRVGLYNYGWIGAVSFSPDGKTVAVGDSGGRVALYDTTTGDLRRMRRLPPALPAPPTA